MSHEQGAAGADADAESAADKQEDVAIADIFAANARLRYMPLIQSSIVRDRAKFRQVADHLAQKIKKVKLKN
jgi:hypothetical protein